MTNQHDPGVKFDSDKPNLDLVLGQFCNALIAVGDIGTFGAKKYSPNGWLEVANAEERYSSAMLRHYCDSKIGNEYDSESDMLHLAHLAWNALAILELRLRR